MIRSSLFCAFLSFSILSSAEVPVERKLYVGKDSTEAIMKFNFQVKFASESNPAPEAVTEQIESQVLHLFGPMGEAKIKAVPKGDHKISNVKVKKGADKGVYLASYSYEGTIVLQNGPTTEYPVILPVDPAAIFEAGAVERRSVKKYPCTDSHYDSEGDFWYFWDPAKPGCPLKKGEDFVIVKATIKRVANTKATYPEYNRLAKDGVIRIDILLGMDDPEKGRDPSKSRDENAQSYRDIRKNLLKMGFKVRAWDKKEILEVVADGPDGALPFVEQFDKKEKKASLQVRLFFGPSGIDEESKAFHYFFKDAAENAGVMIYDGHSGLGGHLDLDAIETNRKFKFEISPKHYQIYFFNSCSSYPYYNKMFFARKQTNEDPKGSKQLDVLTNGLATYFSVMHSTNLIMIQAIQAWASEKATPSYQAIAKQIDSNNLFGVNGDNDNPTTPDEVK